MTKRPTDRPHHDRNEIRSYGDGKAGIIRRGGKVVGCWYVAFSDAVVTMHVLVRTATGAAQGHEFDLASGRVPNEAVEAVIGAGAANPAEATRTFGRIASAWAIEHGHRGPGMPSPRPDALHPCDRSSIVRRPMTKRACSTFLATLDQDALAFVSDGDNHLNRHLHEYYPALDATFVPGATLRRCLTTHPGFSKLFAETWEESPDRFGPDVDTTPLLHDLLRDGRGATRRVIDALPELERAHARAVYVRPPRFTMYEMDLDAHVRVLSALPASWLPRDEPSWSIWMTWWQMVEETTYDVAPEHLAALLDVKGNWERWASRLESAEGGIDRHDMADAFQREIVRPCLARAGVIPDDRSAALLAWLVAFGGVSMRNSMLTSARWHDGVEATLRLMHRLRGPDWPILRWEAGFPDHSDGDIEIRFLTTEPELFAEGASGADANGALGMGHCVGGYGESCFRHGVRVASVRRVLPDGGYERLSTFELHGTYASVGRIEVVQHRGREDGPVPDEADDIVTAYVAGLRDGSIVFDKTAFTGNYDMPGPDQAGYPSSDDTCLSAMIGAWQPHMPARLRGLDAIALGRVLQEIAERHPSARWVPDVMSS